MRFKRMTSVVLCVATLLTSINFSFALDGETINSLYKNMDDSKYYSASVDNNDTNEKAPIIVELVLRDENKIKMHGISLM